MRTRGARPCLTGLYAIAFINGIGLGAYNPIISALLSQKGMSDVWIGTNSTVYFCCMMLTAIGGSRIVGLLGCRRTIGVGMAMSAIFVFVFPWLDQPWQWMIGRALLGSSNGLSMIGAQTVLNRSAEDDSRALTTGLYGLIFSIGLGGGALAGGAFFTSSSIFPFLFGTVVYLVSLPIVGRTVSNYKESIQFQHSAVFYKIALPLFGAFVYGVAEAALISLYPVFLLSENYTISQISYAFTAFIAGGIIGSVAIAVLADRVGHSRMLLFSSVNGLIWSTILITTSDILVVVTCAFLSGASWGPLFTLCLTLVGKTLSSDEMPHGSALFTMTFSCGCALSPILSSVLMHSFGGRHIFTLSIVLLAIFALCLTAELCNALRRRPIVEA